MTAPLHPAYKSGQGTVTAEPPGGTGAPGTFHRNDTRAPDVDIINNPLLFTRYSTSKSSRAPSANSNGRYGHHHQSTVAPTRYLRGLIQSTALSADARLSRRHEDKRSARKRALSAAACDVRRNLQQLRPEPAAAGNLGCSPLRAALRSEAALERPANRILRSAQIRCAEITISVSFRAIQCSDAQMRLYTRAEVSPHEAIELQTRTLCMKMFLI